jgi:hypothetical protein
MLDLFFHKLSFVHTLNIYFFLLVSDFIEGSHLDLDLAWGKRRLKWVPPFLLVVFVISFTTDE